MGYYNEYEKKKKWDDNWRSELKETNNSCYIRLCECRNTRYDIIIMSKLVYKYNKNLHTAEECLIRILEWVGDWNNQFMTADLSRKEYFWAIEEIKKAS